VVLTDPIPVVRGFRRLSLKFKKAVPLGFRLKATAEVCSRQHVFVDF